MRTAGLQVQRVGDGRPGRILAGVGEAEFAAGLAAFDDPLFLD